jgi:hypothetical protein
LWRWGTIVRWLWVLLIGVSGSAYASDWRAYVNDDKGTSYFDASAIRTDSNGYVIAWERTDEKDIPANKVNGKKLTKVIELHQVDCDQSKMRNLQSTFYFANAGTHIAGPQDWVFANPDTVASAFIRRVCAAAGK